MKKDLEKLQLIYENLNNPIIENIEDLEEHTLLESFDSPYNWRSGFKTEMVERDDGEGEYQTEALSPLQSASFTTDSGTLYRWFAKQDRYDDYTWEIVFGVDKGKGPRDQTMLDITINNKGDGFRVFATIVEITNAFIEYGEYDIHRIMFTSSEPSRTKLYKRIATMLDNFRVADIRDVLNDTVFTLERTN